VVSRRGRQGHIAIGGKVKVADAIPRLAEHLGRLEIDQLAVCQNLSLILLG
jgi:hypothetical protein